MTQKSEATALPAGDLKPARRSRLRRALLILGLVVIAVLIVPAWRQASFAVRMRNARLAANANNFDRAIQALTVADRLQPANPEVKYRLAVAYRRTGKLELVDANLQRAEKLGWPKADTDRQRLLMRAQVGRFHEVEQELSRAFTEQMSDEAAIECYEALAHGYYANHQVHDAIRCLDYWINWRPTDVEPRLMRADVYTEFNDPVSAEKEYREILKFAPEHGVAREMAAQLALKGGRVDEARQEYQRCYGGGHRSAGVLFGLAECEYRSSRPEEADRWLAQINTADLPEERQAKLAKLKADIAQFRRDHETVIRLLEDILKVWPHDAAVHQTLGQSYAAVGKQELAEKHLAIGRDITARAERFYNLQRQVIKQPNDPELRFLVGDTLAVQGLLDDAAGWWQSALRCNELHQPSHEALTRYYADKGEEQLAARHRQLAERSAPFTFPRAWEMLVSGNIVGARQQLALLERYPAHQLQCQLLRAGVLNSEQKFEAGLAMLQGPLQDANLRSGALILSGQALAGLHRPLEAERVLQEALALVPDAAEAHRWLAAIYYDLGAVNNAEVHLQQVAALDPKDHRPHRLLGLMNKDYEVYDQAVIYYRESLQRNPDQSSREEVLLELAECLIRQRDYDGALETLEQAIPNPDREALRAECFYNQGKTDEALKLLAEVLAQVPDHQRALLLRADAHLVAGEAPAAVRLLKQAAEKYPYEYEVRYQYAQALDRAGEESEATAQRARADELKQLRERFAKLHEEAFSKIYDAGLRHELARTAEQLGRSDLAQIWEQAATELETQATVVPSTTGEAAAAEPGTNGAAPPQESAGDKPVPEAPAVDPAAPPG